MLLFGSLSDRIGRKRVYGFGIVALGVFCYPFFRLITSGSDLWIISAFIVGNGICHAAMIGVQPALLTELFPLTVRSSGLAMAQAAASIVVGFVPMTAMLLYYTFASILPVAIFMMTLCAISYLSLIGASRI
jgi:MFS family permease